MKLVKKLVHSLASSRAASADSLNQLEGPFKKFKANESGDEVPYAFIDIKPGTTILDLDEYQYRQVRKAALTQLQGLLKQLPKTERGNVSSLMTGIVRDRPVDLAEIPAATGKSSFSIFGCPLELLPVDQVNRQTHLPSVIVRAMSAFVFNGGLEHEGPFRVEGDKAQLAELVEAVSRGYEHEGVTLDNYPSPVLGALIKRYLRQIPGSLFPSAATKMLVKTASLREESLRYLAVHLTILSLPHAHVKVFTTVLLLLGVCAARESVHKMSAASLAVCLGPTIFDTGMDLDLINGINGILAELINDRVAYITIPEIILKSH